MRPKCIASTLELAVPPEWVLGTEEVEIFGVVERERAALTVVVYAQIFTQAQMHVGRFDDDAVHVIPLPRIEIYSMGIVALIGNTEHTISVIRISFHNDVTADWPVILTLT